MNVMDLARSALAVALACTSGAKASKLIGLAQPNAWSAEI
jgi:hypothetical protein